MISVDRSTLVRAIDVSHYQGEIDWPAVAASGVPIAVVKAWQGGLIDPRFAANARGALAAGIVALWYPFLTPGDTAVDVSTAIKAARDNGLDVPMLDWEAHGVSGDVVLRWQHCYEDAANRTGFTYRGIWPPAALTAEITSWPWWLAEYRAQPRVPPWGGVSEPDWTREWAAWQYSGSGRNAGVSTPVDCDVLAVPLARFKAFVDTGEWGSA